MVKKILELNELAGRSSVAVMFVSLVGEMYVRLEKRRSTHLRARTRTHAIENVRLERSID